MSSENAFTLTGTENYMSPKLKYCFDNYENSENINIDFTTLAKADVFSLGITFL